LVITDEHFAISCSEDMSDVINNMEQELAIGAENGNDEEDRTSRETPRRSFDSTSSYFKKRKKEWKGKGGVSNDTLLDMFNEVSDDMKVVTNLVGKMAHAVKHEAAIQEKAMTVDLMQKLKARFVNVVQRLEFTDDEVTEDPMLL
jgi:hypothetical protein